MKHKFLFGSKMLKLDNCRDEDWLTFVNQRGATIKENDYRSISCYKTMLNHFITGDMPAKDSFKALYLYQLSSPFIDKEDYPFSYFNIFNYKRVWVEHLKKYINLESTETWATKADNLPKQFYHLLYQYNMIIEDTHWISDSAKAEVQKIHDLEMPSSYFYELRDLINGL